MNTKPTSPLQRYVTIATGSLSEVQLFELTQEQPLRWLKNRPSYILGPR